MQWERQALQPSGQRCTEHHLSGIYMPRPALSLVVSIMAERLKVGVGACLGDGGATSVASELRRAVWSWCGG